MVAVRSKPLARWLGLGAWVLGGAWAQTSPASAPPPALVLTAEEHAYVQQQGRVRLCVDPDWVPFERLDDEGRHVGIAADLIALVAQRTGLVLEPLVVTSWEESLMASQAGRCQAMSFLNQTPQREVWLRFTAPLFFDQNVLITREEHPYIGDLKAIEGQIMALPVGTMVEERIRKDFPLLKVVTTTTEAEAVELVSSRKADMTLRSLMVAAYNIKQEGLFNLKIAGQVPQYTNELRMGVIKTEPLLLAVLDKAVRSITPQEREAVSNRHVAVQIRQGVDHRLLWQVLAGALGLMLIGGFWHYKLRQVDKARTALTQARVDEALQAQREQSQLVALLSHEVRTALSVIDSSANSLRLLLQPSDAPSLLRVQRIQGGVQRLLNLSEQFLTKDRLEHHTLQPKVEWLDLQVLCQDTIAGFDEAERISLHSSGTTRVQADPALLQVALRNLLANALRYSPAHSPVMVALLGDDEQAVQISVTNQGLGIAPEERAAIFSSYVRGASAQGKPGSGLGLHLVKRVADLHGGSIVLRAAAPEGTVFVLRLPKMGGAQPA